MSLWLLLVAYVVIGGIVSVKAHVETFKDRRKGETQEQFTLRFYNRTDSGTWNGLIFFHMTYTLSILKAMFMWPLRVHKEYLEQQAKQKKVDKKELEEDKKRFKDKKEVNKDE